MYGMNRPVLKVYASLNRHRDEAEVTVIGRLANMHNLNFQLHFVLLHDRLAGYVPRKFSTNITRFDRDAVAFAVAEILAQSSCAFLARFIPNQVILGDC